MTALSDQRQIANRTNSDSPHQAPTEFCKIRAIIGAEGDLAAQWLWVDNEVYEVRVGLTMDAQCRDSIAPALNHPPTYSRGV